LIFFKKLFDEILMQLFLDQKDHEAFLNDVFNIKISSRRQYRPTEYSAAYEDAKDDLHRNVSINQIMFQVFQNIAK
jgi:hypothetical protein